MTYQPAHAPLSALPFDVHLLATEVSELEQTMSLLKRRDELLAEFRAEQAKKILDEKLS